MRFADRARDLAVLEVPGLGLPPVRRRDPAELRPGQTLFAIGHPLGVRHAMSSGILHAVGPLPDGFPVPPRLRRCAWVQADLRLAPGNSGGPIADAEGRVVGVSTMIVGGLALAVPITEVEALLRPGGMTLRIYLGVADPAERRRLGPCCAGTPRWCSSAEAAEADVVMEDAAAARPVGGAARPRPAPHLTAREREVLRLMADGLGNKGIGAALGISSHTAKYHVASVLAKLDAHSRTEAVTRGLREGLLPL